jgi:hypothetical protein
MRSTLLFARQNMRLGIRIKSSILDIPVCIYQTCPISPLQDPLYCDKWDALHLVRRVNKIVDARRPIHRSTSGNFLRLLNLASRCRRFRRS